jgi:hypothetical protein
MNVLLFVVGLAIVLLTSASVLFTIVLPREPRGSQRLSLWVLRLVRLAFVGMSRMARSYERKDAVLAATAPVALVAQLLFWAGLYILGYALIVTATTHDFGSSIVQSAESVFTVGTIDTAGDRRAAIDIAAGATWVVIVALQIAYLPALYATYNRRESLVAMLESRAGLPAWGPELLARHQLVGIIDTLPDFYSSWEQWSADVAESHTTYPVMRLFRSPEPWYSWLIGLLAVLDGAAMHLAVSPTTASSQARLCLRMGFTAFNRIAATSGFVVESDPNPEGPIVLTFEEFDQAVGMLRDVGFPMEHGAEEAWPNFRGWRVNYEPAAYYLADRFTAPPAPWSGQRRHLRAGVVQPHRPPQRRPGKLSEIRPPVVIAPSSRRSGGAGGS